MPNTLCHIAIQGGACHKLLPPSAFAWILLGCILPDIPWIELHIVQGLHIVHPYSLRYYCTAQASLLFCAFLAGGIAMFTQKSKTVFLILLGNSLLHLLLDSLQIKWGNGVNIIAPFDWHLFSAALIWTDTLTTRIITIAGFFYLLLVWQKNSQTVSQYYHIALPSGKKLIVALCCLSGWIFGPLLCFPAMERADTYSLHTLQQKELRTGKTIAFDRIPYDAEQKMITIFSGEKLRVTGKLPEKSGIVSIQGVFRNPQTVASSNFHCHENFRDQASLVGLFLTCLFLCHSLLLPRFFPSRR